MDTPAGLIPADVELEGLDGNAIVIIGAVSRGLRRAGNSKDVLDAFANEAMSGDYDHVLQTAIAYTS